MKLQRREKILLGAALGIVVLAGFWFLLLMGDSRSTEQLLAEQAKLTGEIAQKQRQLDQAAHDRKRLAEWQRRSLPPDPALARSLYQNWLRTVSANLKGATLRSTDAGARHSQFVRIAFELSARAKLTDLVAFMYEFYKAGYLHQIRKLEIKPIQSTRELDVKLTIEALSLPTAVAKVKLPDLPGQGLKLAKLSEYSEPLVSRDLFAAYAKPAPPATAPRRDKTVDPADFAFVTGFTEVDGATEVWLQDRMGNKLQKLVAGATFTIGGIKGTVETIDPEGDVIVEYDGHRRMLHAGDNLHGGTEIQATPAKQPDQANNSSPDDSDEDN